MPGQFLTADWNNLLMASYIIDRAVLLPYLPFKTELDTYNGYVYVSLVGFLFSNTRVMGIKIPFHVNFEEVNLRFYVKYNDNGKWKRGVVFIRETVPKRAISFIANNLYHEKYCTKRMNHFFGHAATEMNLVYQWQHQNKWNKIEAIVNNETISIPPGSVEEFISEHYWGYTKYSDTTTFEYNVQHPAWKLYPLKNYMIDCDFIAMYGGDFIMLQNAVPISVFVAQGSPIAVLKKKKL